VAHQGQSSSGQTPPPCSVYLSLSMVPVGALTLFGGWPSSERSTGPRRRAHRAPLGRRRAPGGLPVRGGGRLATGQAMSVAPVGDFPQERLQMFTDDGVEERVLGCVEEENGHRWTLGWSAHRCLTNTTHSHSGQAHTTTGRGRRPCPRRHHAGRQRHNRFDCRKSASPRSGSRPQLWCWCHGRS
jgi:hypothetical protein